LSNRYLPPSPLPFENNGARTLFPEEHAPLDVVESDSSGRSGLHPHLGRNARRPRGFVAPTLFDVTGNYDLGDTDTNDDLNDNDGSAPTTSAGNARDADDYATSRAELLRRDYDDRAANRLAPNASAMTGESSGALGPGFEVVDVPLRGPGTWTLTSSASTSQSLQCGDQTIPVLQQIVVGATQSCQLEISSTSSEASLTCNSYRSPKGHRRALAGHGHGALLRPPPLRRALQVEWCGGARR